MKTTKRAYRFIGIGVLSILLAFVIYILTALKLFEHPYLYVIITIIGMSLISAVINYLFYDKQLGHVLSETANLKFKNIIYSLLVESSNIDNRDDFYNLILAKAIEAIPNADKGSILHKDENSRMIFKAANGHDLDALKKVELYIEQTFLYTKTDGKLDKTTIIDDFINVNEKNLEKDEQETLDNMILEMQTVISTPIWVDGQIWGMINIDSYHKNAFDLEAIDSLEIFAIEVAKTIKLYDTLENNKYLIRHDVLTDTINRAYFNQILEETLEESELPKTGILVSIDLDKFKRINDIYGHYEGDKYLVYFTEVIKEHLREIDIFSRYGGDEFLILLDGLSSDEAEGILKKMIEAFEKSPYIIEGNEEIIEFSYGLVKYPKEGMTNTDLLKLADSRMYAHKNSKMTTPQ